MAPGTHVALLRGVNVGARHPMAMGELRTLFQSLGFTDVTTHLRSGNVVFTSGRTVDGAGLERAITDRFGFPCPVVLRRPQELRAVVAGNPFPGVEGTRLHVGFLPTAPESARVRTLELDRYAPEQAVVDGAQVYYHLPNGMGRARLPGMVDRRLGSVATVRNWNTVVALCERAGG